MDDTIKLSETLRKKIEESERFLKTYNLPDLKSRLLSTERIYIQERRLQDVIRIGKANFTYKEREKLANKDPIYGQMRKKIMMEEAKSEETGNNPSKENPINEATTSSTPLVERPKPRIANAEGSSSSDEENCGETKINKEHYDEVDDVEGTSVLNITTEDETLLTDSTSNSSSTTSEDDEQEESSSDSSTTGTIRKRIKRKKKQRVEKTNDRKRQRIDQENEETKKLKIKLKEQEMELKKAKDIIRKSKRNKGILKNRRSPNKNEENRNVTFHNQEDVRNVRARSVAPENSQIPHHRREEEISNLERMANQMTKRRITLNYMLDDITKTIRRAETSRVKDSKRIQFKLKLLKDAKEKLEAAKVSVIDISTRY